MGSMANLTFQVKPFPDNISMTWNGFDDSIPTFVSETLERMEKMKSAQLVAFFDQVKEKTLQNWKNDSLEQAYLQGMKSFGSLISDAEYQKKNMSEVLLKYSYDDFKTDQEKWLKTGKQVWFVGGNIDEVQTTKMVTEARKQLNLNECKIEDLTPIKTMLLEEGNQYVIEKPLEDKTNQNSCNLTYF